MRSETRPHALILEDEVSSLRQSRRTDEAMRRGLCERKCRGFLGLFHSRGEGFLLRATASRTPMIDVFTDVFTN